MSSLYDVSEMLKQARRDANLSQEAIASRAGGRVTFNSGAHGNIG